VFLNLFLGGNASFPTSRMNFFPREPGKTVRKNVMTPIWRAQLLTRIRTSKGESLCQRSGICQQKRQEEHVLGTGQRMEENKSFFSSSRGPAFIA
jgi:hypothetical protein